MCVQSPCHISSLTCVKSLGFHCCEHVICCQSFMADAQFAIYIEPCAQHRDTSSCWTSNKESYAKGFYAGCKAELSELLFPLRLKFEDLGRRQTLSTDKQRGDWHRDLRHRWDGSLVVFTPQHATDHAALLGLARLCSMLRYYSPLLACFVKFLFTSPTCLK